MLRACERAVRTLISHFKRRYLNGNVYLVRLPLQKTKTDHATADAAYPVICPLPMEFGPYELINVSLNYSYIFNGFFRLCYMSWRSPMMVKQSFSGTQRRRKLLVMKRLIMNELVFIIKDQHGLNELVARLFLG